MTTQICEAIFQNGAFRPIQPISASFTEGQHVRLVVELEGNDMLSLATGVYDGLSDTEIKEVEQIALEPRPFGLCAGEFVVPDDFNAPLPTTS